jgi:Tfp pilus assembly protein PilO
VSAVDGWADDAGIVIEHLSPTPATAATAAAPLPADTSAVAVTLGARGGYEGLMGFVDSLIAADRIVVVDRIELRADEESADVLLDLDIRIFTTDRLVESTTGDPDAATADALDAGVVGQLDGADLTGEGP